jgi:hypothetical protein
MVANTSEYYVPNYSGGGDAIFNRDMVKTMGLPSGAKKLNAASGFIPNFNLKGFSDYMRSRGISAGQVNRGAKDFSRAYRQNTDGYREQYDKLSPLEQRNISKRYEQQVQLGRAKGATGKSKYGIMYSDVIGGTPVTNLKTVAGNNIRAVPIDTQPPNKLYTDIRNSMVKSAQEFAATLGFSPDIIQDSKFLKAADKSLNPGSVESAFGTVFEAAFQGALGIPQKVTETFDLKDKNSIKALIDRGKAEGLIKSIKGSIGDLTAVDIKNALNKENLKSIDNKIAFAEKKKQTKTTRRRRRSALGYIPNFQKSALEESIERERAAGIPINQIRINQDGSLRNSQNPGGLAVTNMRDEPTGRIPNFAKGDTPIAVEKLGTNALLASTLLYGLSSAFGNAESSLGQFISKLTLSLSALSTLALFGPQIDNLSGTLLSFGSAAKKGGVQFGRVGTFLLKFGKVLGPLSTMFGTLLKFAGPIGIAFSVLIPIITMVTSKFDLFGKKAEEAAKAQEEFANRIKSLPTTEKERTEREITERLGAAKTERRQLEAELGGMVPFVGRGSQNLNRKQQERREEIESRLGVLTGGGEVKGSIVSLARQQRSARQAILDDPATKAGGDARTLAGITLAPQGLVEVRNVFGQLSAANQAATNEALFEQNRQSVGGFTTQGEKTVMDFAERRVKLEGELNQARLDALETLAEQSIQEAKLEGIESEKLSTLLGQVDAQTDIEEFGAKLNEITGLEANQREKIRLKAEELKNEFSNQADILEDNITTEEAIALLKAGQADSVKDANRALNLQTLTLQKNATLEKINSDAKKAGLELQLQAGGLTPQQERNIQFELQEIELKERLADATLEQKNAEKLKNAEAAKTGDEFDQGALDKAEADLEIANKRLEVTEKQIEAERKLNEERRAETGFDRGVRKLNEDIAKFGDQLGEQIPGKFADNLGQAMSDALSGAKDLDEALSDAGRNFLGYIRDAFLQQAAAQTASASSGIFKTVFSAVAGAFTGGIGGGAAPGTIGGLTPTQFVAMGGVQRGGLIPKKFNRGGAVGSDVVPAMLTPGEFIMSRDAVNKYGLQMLTRMNEGVTSIATMQNGGLISPAAAPVGGGSSQVNNNSEFTFNIQGGNTEQQQGSQQESMQDREFAKRIRSAVTQVVSEESRRGGSLAYLYTQ